MHLGLLRQLKLSQLVVFEDLGKKEVHAITSSREVQHNLAAS